MIYWIVYAVAGIGLYGAYKNLKRFGKVLYFAVFPIHWLLLGWLSAIRRNIGIDSRWITVPLLLAFWGVVGIFSADFLIPGVICSLMLLVACSQKKW